MVQNRQNQDSLHFLTDKISFNNIDVSFLVRKKEDIRVLITSLVEKEKKAFGFFSFNFCSDKYLLKINKKYLNHKDLTDIITFDLSENDIISGDIYISTERVKDNAHLYKKKCSEEIIRVMIHGVLHLCGYSDKTPADISLMRRKENHYLSLWA